MPLTLKDSRSYETQVIEAVRSVNKALGGTYGNSSAIYKSDYNQYEVQLIDAIKGIARTLSGSGLSVYGGADGGAFVTQDEFQALVRRVQKLEDESFFQLVDGNVTLKDGYENLWVPGWLAAGGIGSGSGGGGVSYLRMLTDVYHDSNGVLRANGDPVSAGDALVYDTTHGWVAALVSSGGATTLEGLNDVSYSARTPQNGDLLTYDGTNSVWRPVAKTAYENVQADWSVTDNTSYAFIKNKPDIIDAQITSPASGQGLTYNGSKWVNSSVRTINGTSIFGSGNISIPVITVDTALDSTSTNPVQNKAIYTALAGKMGIVQGTSGNFAAFGTGGIVDSGHKHSDYVTVAGAQTITGAKTFNATITSSDVVPRSNNTYKLGSTSNRWGNIYGVAANLTGNLTMSSSSKIDLGPIRLEYYNTGSANALRVTSNDGTTANFFADGYVAAGGTGTASGGGSGGGMDLDRMWASLTNTLADNYANTKINLAHIPSLSGLYLPLAGGTMTGNIILNGVNLLPATDSTCTVGNSTYRFADANIRNIHATTIDFRPGNSPDTQIGSIYCDGTLYQLKLGNNGSNGEYNFGSATGLFHSGNGAVPLGRSDHRWGTLYAVDANLSGVVIVNGINSIDQSDSGMSLYNYGGRTSKSFNGYGTSINFRACNSNGVTQNILAVNQGVTLVGKTLRPDYNTSNVDLGANTNDGGRWANIYGVNEDLTGNLTMLRTSTITIGPVTISYDGTNHALHVSGTDSGTTIGLYCDGYVAAGGIAPNNS